MSELRCLDCGYAGPFDEVSREGRTTSACPECDGLMERFDGPPGSNKDHMGESKNRETVGFVEVEDGQAVEVFITDGHDRAPVGKSTGAGRYELVRVESNHE